MLLSIILIYFSGYWTIYCYPLVLIIIVELLNRQNIYIGNGGGFCIFDHDWYIKRIFSKLYFK